MILQVRHRWLGKQAARLLLVFAILLRLAVPPGFMIAQGSDWALIKCPVYVSEPTGLPAQGHNAHHSAMNQHGTQASGHVGTNHDPSHTRDHAQQCPYAALASSALPPDLAMIEVPPLDELESVAAPRSVTSAPPSLAMPPPARGPPILS